MRLSLRSIALLGLAAAGPMLAAAPRPRVRADAGAVSNRAQEAFRFDGEYGLYVRIVDDGLEVRWITEDRSRGVIHAYAGEEELERVHTSKGQAHWAHIETSAPVVDLQYGAEGGELYNTRIDRIAPEPPALVVEGVDSVYMFGDVHGEFDRVVGLLGKVGLIDDALRWSGGDRHLVFLGDLFDRGDDVTRVLWFLYGLERQAAAAGGAVHVVLGNHELMVMSGYVGYVSGKETLIAQAHGVEYATMFHPKESVLGRWLASKPGLVRLEDLLLAHGGVGPQYVEYTLEEYQDTLRAFMDEELFVRWNDSIYLAEFRETTEVDSAGVSRRYEFFFGEQSVPWYRDLVNSDTLGAYLDRVLTNFDAHVHIVGHTIVPTIGERYGGRLIATDLREAASEMLLLARGEDGEWDRFMIPLVGSPKPLGDPHTR